MRLYEFANVIRSKNAGPFTLTIDLMFEDRAKLERVLACDRFTPDGIARLYGVDCQAVQVHAFPQICTVKVSLPRPGASSGAPGDCDVYGCQQHFPLANLQI